MRNLRVILLVLLALGTEPLLAANYQFQALIDLDGDLTSGCAVEVGETPLSGSELRTIARTDRNQVVEVVLQSCHDSGWHDEMRAPQTAPIRFGQGNAGSDRIRWSVPLSHFSEHPLVSLRMVSERLDQPAHDLVDDGEAVTILNLNLADLGHALPVMGGAGLWIAALLLLCLGWRHLRHGGQHAPPVMGLLLILGAIQLAQPISLANADRILSVAAADTGNDSADAGSDILRTRIAVVGENLEFQIDVNNIEDNGLADHARILFIGNSLTYANDLPLMVQAIAAQSGKVLAADAITLAGAALEDHFHQATAHAALANGGYQWVIMQQGPSTLPRSQNNLRTWAGHFDPLIRAGGARPALYMVWPDAFQGGSFNDVRDAYSNAASAINGMFIPAGESWREAWRENPDLPLYSADQFHPSALGSYAAGLSIFAELYQQSPTGLPARLSLSNGTVLDFDPDQVRTIQSAAWRTHLALGRRGD
ncbi:MAG TPA: hypothetical protein VFN25_16415 [Dokdonella sp.]|uniref:hypothetical protein n=1 Tax=Dokdonella sp. TaxID=2291710 RepID=UPI002D7F9BBC|nr:hypothetical protein [Dokdonella sp.]HET9034474.1 hypothetical protein [Dokdonella sp.]